ncbi:anhydro-N-acetylmuramic acid kinase [Halioxenophilus sp. WMMB6]|uniref:anhydro-N-acetylmuramic acid kinase n=1 Tax=Halioxenophilus sp. WMMB6 TaxID=3073815 RepID=UPI00295F04B6|nr:anhydro-N-acetylmuramic acid kinase [Halioxenophilus sp. WMMB6]
MTRELYVGLMSGTSIDSIDAALVEISEHQTQLLSALSYPLQQPLKQQLLTLCHDQQVDIDLFGACDRQLAQHFASASNSLLTQAGVDAAEVKAIGSHGQTIRHRPSGSHGGPFTLQIGDPNIIALCTGIDTVADFRRMDMAGGGQAAPLAPIFHQAFFQSREQNRTLINIGGMSNVTWLPRTGDIRGFDLGPGNALMDAWIDQHRQQPFDRDGQWAASGTVISELLDRLLSHPFFSLPAPKSTGREDFHLGWLNELLAALPTTPRPADVQATLLELTAQSIVAGIKGEFLGEAVFICGGGAHNRTLLERLSQLLAPVPVTTTNDLGIAPDWVEACGFAWLAHRRLAGLAGNHPAVTGADQFLVLGGVYLGNATKN